MREPAGAASSHDVERFLALLTGLLMNRSAHGTRKVPPAELRAIATTAVRMFLAAYGTGADRPESALRPR
ncbi:TetR/AcrR family transcriptional regulator C-terminal domain-containing protein [Nocardia grenadensis]|uniref:TetR/AcrR family transcriptional regulator C-terminal domain-containing protein n=1 Tax=Nocardia grenadensis TaxID=931537 RepID=UPI0007A50AD1|nr:TetR/AcrR family transcriptional regulator C-terminal domain-containing protein [Nocardia grenadensis]